MKEPAKKWLDSSIFRFAMVGLFNTVLGAAIMFVLYNLLHLSYWFSTAANYVVMCICDFILNKYFTFKSKGRFIKQVVPYLIVTVAAYFVGFGFAKPLVRWILSDLTLTMRDDLAMMAGMFLSSVVNYLGQRFFAFRD